jgi:hypothetical protein
MSVAHAVSAPHSDRRSAQYFVSEWRLSRAWKFSLGTLQHMQRLIVLFAIVVAMLWQSAALARGGAAVDAQADAAHAALHWQGDAHHHHDDGSIAIDDSEESARHLMADQTSTTALLPLVTAALPRLHDSAPRPGSVRASPHPFLDGPLRPPRPTC